MFKSLLRTLPSLSGNFSLSCKLNEIKKIDKNNYYTYVRVGNLVSLQNNMYGNDIELNLLNGRYEYDVQKYFNKYSNYFYKENYIYDNKNFKVFNLYSKQNELIDDRNKDYEFGCKRLYYSRSGYQFSFYAPIYIDNANDLPEYFFINIKLSNNIEKTIKVYINKDNKVNYLKRYLTSYLKNIDNKVIFCLRDSLQATYYGLDVKNGGLVQYKDNIFGLLYENQMTINNFDRLICQGFERNNLIMQQIIPLNFEFNINDILSKYEKEFFIGSPITITGYYCSSNNVKYNMFDFDINYWNLYNSYKKFNLNVGKYMLSYGDDGDVIDIADVDYPALNEEKYIKYQFTNKITPNYCKFKMMLSNDNDPYITNVNFAYSYLQYPNQKYGYFPTILKGLNPELICINGDAKLPIGNNVNNYYIEKYSGNKVIVNSVNFNKYKKLMNNYISSWFTIINDFDNIDNIIGNDSLWVDVDHNYSYYKGVLYDLNQLADLNINKFGVFLSYETNYISETDLNNNFIKGKYVLSNSDESDITVNSYNDLYDLNYYDENIDDKVSKKLFNNLYISNISYLHLNKLMVKDQYGKYVKINSYYDSNSYYMINDIVNLLNDENILSYNDQQNLISILNEHKTFGYKLLNAYNNKNCFNVSYDLYGNKEIKIMLYNAFNGNQNLYIEYKWLIDNLYYLEETTGIKKKIANNFKSINYNSDYFGKFYVFFQTSFIHKTDLLSIISEFKKNHNINYITFINKINSLSSYVYEKYNSDGLNIYDYFIKSNTYENKKVYIDSYNLKKLIEEYNESNSIKLPVINSNAYEKKNFYIKILNKDHLNEYYYKISENEKGESILQHGNLLDNLYVKTRCWVIDDNINIKDTYVSLYDYIMNSKISYNSEDEEFIYYMKEFINIYASNDNDIIFNWLISKLSDVRNSDNKFTLNIGSIDFEFDLCINKDVYVFNDYFRKLMFDKNSNIQNYLYLYIQNECINENNDYWDILSSQELNEYINKDINDYLTPLFTNIYINDNDKQTLINMFQYKKINNNNEYVNNFEYFKEIETQPTEKCVLSKIYENKEYIFNDFIASNNIEIPNEYNKTLENKLTYVLNNESISLRKMLMNVLIYNFNTNLALLYYYDDDNNIVYNIEYIISLLKNKNYQNDLKKYLIDNNIYDEYEQYANDNNLENDLHLNILKFLNTNYNDLYYKLFSLNNIILFSISNALNVSLDHISNDQLEYNEKYKLYIYNKNDVKYGFFNVHINIDNTNNTFYIYNDFNLNVNFDTLNGFDLKATPNKYFNNYLKLLLPFMRLNIFEEYCKLNNLIVYPYENEILIKYKANELSNMDEYKKYKMLIDNNGDKLYDKLIELQQYKKIKLLRYFNFITPYLKETSIINNCFTFNFMKLNSEYLNIEKYNILNKQNINIYKYNPLIVWDDYNYETNEFNKKEKIYQLEYKHFNDNKFYNLPEFIEYVDDHIYSTKEINELQNLVDFENIMKDKKINILYKIFGKNNLVDNNVILFLFNKYNSSFFIEKENNSYKIRYKFTLI